MDIKSKIELLLAKAEGTDNIHERDTYNAKAEKLMLQYGIEQAELESRGEVKAEDITEVRLEFTGVYAVVMPGFVYNVCRALGNLTVLQQNGARSTKYAYIIGFKSDVEWAQMLIASLHTQALHGMKRWWKEFDDKQWMTPMEQYKSRRQFVSSFAAGAADRIKSERREEEKDISPGAALVLASKQDQVDAWTHQQHRVGKARGGAQSGMAGSQEGRAAGRQANVGTTALGGSRAALN